MTSTNPTSRQPASLEPTGSRAWTAFLRVFFRTTPTPAMRLLRRTVGSVPIEELVITGRRSGRERHLLLTLLEIDGKWYIGHPNGASQWVRNLVAAGSCVVIRRDGQRTRVMATELPDGPERDAVIAATSRQPFPANLVYRAARSHILAVGRYFRLDPVPDDEGATAST